jgi:hypothetical protein
MNTHNGSCACGAVRFRAEILAENIFCCRCRYCTSKNLEFVLVLRSQFDLLSGAEKLICYDLGSSYFHHTFCSDCGIEAFAYVDYQDKCGFIALSLNCVEWPNNLDLPYRLFDCCTNISISPGMRVLNL